ncbi:hypothetical protein GTY75_32430 [Streptomyces sp. SID8381]|uniref:hypothetical protein n=1 Tax=unclassified Streptomyces TaxID=2593676 RepID=UPI001319C8C3|nr:MULTISPECIES: hypothetical protein [unclassified Streptomyces]MYX31271.1 hypothetical protein [Streptomyces sp. SID8381]
MAEPLTDTLFTAIGKLASTHTYMDYHLSRVARLMAGSESEEVVWILFEGRSTEQVINDMTAMIDVWLEWPEKYLPPISERPRISEFRSTLKELKILNELRNEVIHGVIITEPDRRQVVYPPWGKSPDMPTYLFARSRIRKGVTRVSAFTISDIDRIEERLWTIARQLEDLYRNAQQERESLEEAAAEAALPEYLRYTEEHKLTEN